MTDAFDDGFSRALAESMAKPITDDEGPVYGTRFMVTTRMLSVMLGVPYHFVCRHEAIDEEWVSSWIFWRKTSEQCLDCGTVWAKRPLRRRRVLR